VAKIVYGFSITLFVLHDRLLETDKRALTRIKSTSEAANEIEQKSTDQKSTDQKSIDQKSTGSVDRKSVASLPDNMELLSDSPSLSRKATDEEMWYVVISQNIINLFLIIIP